MDKPNKHVLQQRHNFARSQIRTAVSEEELTNKPHSLFVCAPCCYATLTLCKFLRLSPTHGPVALAFVQGQYASSKFCTLHVPYIIRKPPNFMFVSESVLFLAAAH